MWHPMGYPKRLGLLVGDAGLSAGAGVAQGVIHICLLTTDLDMEFRRRKVYPSPLSPPTPPCW